jgi:chromosome segregation ATPase
MRGLVAVALGATLLAGGCKKTVEGENKAWDRNIQRINQLAAVYPGFASALQEQQKRAEDAMTAARSIGSQEEAAKKMAEANALIDSGFVYTLSQIDSRTRTLRDKIVTVTTEAEHGADQVAAKALTDDAQRILQNVDATLKQGAPNAGAAQMVLAKVEQDISSAGANLDKIIAAARQRKAEAAKATAAAPAAGAAGAPGAPVAKVQWKCSYCSHMNDDSRQKCENCGAPRSEAKTKAAPTVVKKK